MPIGQLLTAGRGARPWRTGRYPSFTPERRQHGLDVVDEPRRRRAAAESDVAAVQLRQVDGRGSEEEVDASLPLGAA
jgi:hypothetical protein